MKYFITFAAGSDDYIKAGERLIKQANDTELFDNTFLYTDKSLQEDSIFWTKHKDFIMNNKRGFGYWIWKPYIIKKTLEDLGLIPIL